MLPECGALGVTAATVEAAIDEGPKPAALLLTRPTYYGLARTLEPIVAVCRRHGVPLLVDEAHGPHLKFLPAGRPDARPRRRRRPRRPKLPQNARLARRHGAGARRPQVAGESRASCATR